MPRRNLHHKEAVLRGVKFLLIIILVGLISYFVPLHRILTVLRSASLRFVCYGFIVVLPYVFFDSLQTKVLFRELGIVLSAWRLFLIDLKVRFYQMFVPGTIAGTGVRVFLYYDETNALPQVAVIVAYKRVYNLLGAFLFTLLFLALQSTFTISAFSTFLLLIGMIILLISLLTLPSLGKIIEKFIERYILKRDLPVILQRVGKKAKEFFFLINELSSLGFKGHGILLLSYFTGNFFALLSYYYISQAVGLQIDFVTLSLVRFIVVISLFLPINLLPSISAREVGFAAMLVALGMDEEKVGAFVLLTLGRTVFLALLGTLVILLTRSRNILFKRR